MVMWDKLEKGRDMAADIGVYGLGTMGSALALNLAEQGFDVAVSNREADWIGPFLSEAEGLAGTVTGHAELDFSNTPGEDGLTADCSIRHLGEPGWAGRELG